jgi:hypothetical protein
LKKSPDEVREAVVHFELYRCLKNCISSEERFDGIRFIDVEPEFRVGDKLADLVVKAVLNDSSTYFLVIEVKKRTKEGFPIFDPASIDQVKGYAKPLSALYYGITDGQRLRLFRTLDDNLINNYSFCLDESAVKQLLEELSDLHSGKTSQLQFNIVENPSAKIEELTRGFSRLLLDLFNEISGKGAIVVTQHGKVKWLNIGVHKGILRLGLNKEISKTYIDIRLKILQEALGANTFVKLMKKLSEIPGFQWVRDRTDPSKPFIWSPITSIIANEKPDYNKAKKGLRKWLLELNKVLR